MTQQHIAIVYERKLDVGMLWKRIERNIQNAIVEQNEMLGSCNMLESHFRIFFATKGRYYIYIRLRRCLDLGSEYMMKKLFSFDQRPKLMYCADFKSFCFSLINDVKECDQTKFNGCQDKCSFFQSFHRQYCSTNLPKQITVKDPILYPSPYKKINLGLQYLKICKDEDVRSVLVKDSQLLLNQILAKQVDLEKKLCFVIKMNQKLIDEKIKKSS